LYAVILARDVNMPEARVSRLPHLLRRTKVALYGPGAATAFLAILIGFASVLSAAVAWRASLASIDASRYESLAVQQQARIQQIQRELGGRVAQDLRFVNVFQEHALAARELKAQADQLRTTDPDAADILDLQSHAQLDLARGVLPFFLGATGPALNEYGTVTYDVAYVVRNLEVGSTELRELQTQRTTELADRAEAKSVSLIGVAALVVAALFFLTIAQVVRTRVIVRQMFFAAGAVLVTLGTVSLIVVEVLA
jgi:hypothetical protein